MTTNFRTIIEHQTIKNPINHSCKIMMLGSCFSKSIGNLFQKNQFDITINPFGITYNPISIATSLELILSDKIFDKSDLIQHQELFVSLFHHGDFNNTDWEVCLNQINESLLNAREKIKQIQYLFITLGTNTYYHHIDKNIIANNCHKLASNQFEKKVASVDMISSRLLESITKLLQINSNCTIVFTVSPIRYLQDGNHANSLNKSALFLAIQNIMNSVKNSYYFPAYEIIMDDLRDYRFYKEDMLHPNDMAIQYIWQHVLELLIDSNAIELLKRIDKINTMKAHRPINPHSEAHSAFLRSIKLEIEKIRKENPTIQLNF